MKRIILYFLSAFCCAVLLTVGVYSYFFRNKETIKVGVLHSMTGTMASSERPVVDAVLMAIDEINEKGGLLGCQIEPIVVDGKSNWSTFAQQAEWLITEEKAQVIFGCWTSASRKEVKPIVEKYNNLLFYPVQYEGAESSSNIIYTGATSNQQIFPGVNWSYDNLGKKFYIVGSDYVYPRIAGIIMREQLNSLDAEILGEQYFVLGTQDVQDIVQDIKIKQPDVILNNINGDTNGYFFKALREAGITSDKIPTMSFSIAEAELQQMDISLTIGDYAVWSYFQSIDSQINKDFIKNFQEQYGKDRVITDPMEAAYFGVYLWSRAVFLAQSSDPEKVIDKIASQSKKAPEGIIYTDGFNHHTWKYSRIGKVNSQGQFDIQWSSEKAIYPVVYPYKSSDEWNDILNNLYQQWGGKWAKE
ncbi:MAG: urea ABC transporter substrate-binding protein [Candidatus Dependentiae bacterium]